MSCINADFNINKKSKLYHVIELKTTENNPISLNGYTVKCEIKESYATGILLFELTETNEGVIVIDRANGIFALNIKSDKTDIPDINYGVYDVIIMENDYIGLENKVIVKGKIKFIEGVTNK